MKILEIFWRFLILGLVSFGGPAAHIGYFQKKFVAELAWLSQQQYAGLVALSQFLPGPGSSQVGFAIGHERAGVKGGVAAFLGFTLPSFVIMYVLAAFLTAEHNSLPLMSAIIDALKLLAVVVVADAIFTMANNFCTNKITISISIITTILLLLYSSMLAQFFMLLFAAAIGLYYRIEINNNRSSNQMVAQTNEQTYANNVAFSEINYTAFSAFILIFVGLPLLINWAPELSLFSSFFNTGSLVYGGGHVVLPLLQEITESHLDTETFLFGYAAAQAIPGPMFTLATYLGAKLTPDNMFLGATVATLAIFLPGFILVIAFKKAWRKLTQLDSIAGAIVAINASVVGLLMAAFYQPIFVSAVKSSTDVAFVLLGFWLMRYLKLPIIYMVVGFMIMGLLRVSI